MSTRIRAHPLSREISEAGRKANRRGRPTEGLYPHISRKALAAELGCDMSTVSQVLSGRVVASKALFEAMVRALRVEPHMFERALLKAQRRSAAERVERLG